MTFEAELQMHGYGLEKNAIDATARAELLAVVADPALADVSHSRTGERFASRALLLRAPRLRSLLIDVGISRLATRALGAPAFPVDALFFNKHASANWVVPGHQDRLFPVTKTDRVQCFMRSGVPYAQPPLETLSSMVALRVHFDATDEDSGAISLVPGSHLRGCLSDEALKTLPLENFKTCSTEEGDVLFMRPLTVHRSSPVRGDSHRRVLHVVYATREPEGELRWASFDDSPRS